MSTLSVQVSGSYLVWNDGATQYRVVGAIPQPVPSGFSGQPSGRIWVASLDRYLWYSDSTGTTRFVQGINRGTTSIPNGRVFANRGTCPTVSPPAQDLYWASSGSLQSARAEGVYQPKSVPMAIYTNASASAGNVTATLTFQMLGTTVPFAVTASGFTLTTYSNSTCTDNPVSINMSSSILPNEFSKTAVFTSTSGRQSFKITTSSVAVEGVTIEDESPFCLYSDYAVADITNIYDGCFTAGIDGTVDCNNECIPGSSTPSEMCKPSGSSACTSCTGVRYRTVEGVQQQYYVCIDPIAGDPGNVGGDGDGCGRTCTADTVCAEISPNCPSCINGECGVSQT